MLGPWIKVNWKWSSRRWQEWALKWLEMGEFNSDNHYIYYCGQESLRRNGVAIIVNKSPKCSTWMQPQKWQNDFCLFSRQTIQYTVIQVYAPTSNAEEAEVERFYEDLHDLLGLTPPKRCPFHYRGLEYKNRKAGDTWNNRQGWPWSTDWSRAKAISVLQREHAGLSKQHKRRLYTWTSPDGQHRNQIDYILCRQRWRSSIQSAKTRLGVDCG